MQAGVPPALAQKMALVAKVGEGTYGAVYQAVIKETGQVRAGTRDKVALAIPYHTLPQPGWCL